LSDIAVICASLRHRPNEGRRSNLGLLARRKSVATRKLSRKAENDRGTP
jgi:hypothetical protein